jgi:hypothetical protein
VRNVAPRGELCPIGVKLSPGASLFQLVFEPTGYVKTWLKFAPRRILSMLEVSSGPGTGTLHRDCLKSMIALKFKYIRSYIYTLPDSVYVNVRALFKKRF